MDAIRMINDTLRPVLGASRAQFHMSRRTIRDLSTLINIPLYTIIFMAILAYAGRNDLASYTLVAPLLMTVGQMAFMVASDLVAQERNFDTLELTVATPTPFPLVLFPRIAVITSVSFVAIFECWLIIRFVFDVTLTVHHPWLLALTIIVTSLASAGTALVTAAVFVFARTARTFQNAIIWPLFLLAGVLVPISVFPGWLQPFSRGVFLYWSANLLRDAMDAAAPERTFWCTRSAWRVGRPGWMGTHSPDAGPTETGGETSYPLNWLRVFRFGLLVGSQELRYYWNWKTWLSGWMAQQLAQVAFFAVLGLLLDSPDRVRFLLIGHAVAIGAMAAGWAIQLAPSDRFDGTYPLLVIAPSSIIPAITGRTIIWLGNGVATCFVTFVILGVVFGVAFPWPDTLLLVPLVLLTLTSTYCLALFLGSVVIRLPASSNMIHGFSTLIYRAFCGVSVPVSYWPGWIETAVQFLPITHGVQAIRLLLDRGSAVAILEAAGLEILVGLGWLLVAMLAMDRMAQAGRRDGSIEIIVA